MKTIQEQIDEAAKPYETWADSDGYSQTLVEQKGSFKAGAAFALPLGERKGFERAIDFLKEKIAPIKLPDDRRMHVDAVIHELTEEGIRLGILEKKE